VIDAHTRKVAYCLGGPYMSLEHDWS